MSRIRLPVAVVLSMWLATSASPQDAAIQSAGRIGTTVAGTGGVRQTREDTTRNPLVRLDNRNQTRVQNRVRNRIDRNYDPLGNATAAYSQAAVRAQTSGQEQR